MKFKIHNFKENKHKGTVTCLGWNGNEEVFSVGDEHQIYKWNIKSKECIEIAKLPDDFFPTDLHWLISKQMGSSKNTDSLLITSSDGRFIILNKNSRVERSVDAHTGCITSGKWSADGAGLMTSGEDGTIKVWSRSGMLRSTVVQNEGIIRCACWSPKSDAIAYCQAQFIAIKPLAANSKLRKWRAHEGLVFCLSWSNDTQYLASGGEDCRYKVWDSQGAIIYSSAPEEYAITSIDFCPDGKLLAVGGFNFLKLCNYNGWSHCNTKFSNPPTGSLFSITWSPDGTQIISGSSSGSLVCGYVIEKELISKNLRAKTIGRQTIQLHDINARTSDTLEFPERIICWALGYGHLVVGTTSQVHVYNEKYMNTPLSVIDGRIDVRIILLSKRNFLLLDSTSVWIYTYSGRLHLNPKYGGLQAQINSLNLKCISLGHHYLAIRDNSDKGLIHIFDLVPGASRQTDPIPLQTKTNVEQIDVTQSGPQDDQYIAFLDSNRDLFCTQCGTTNDKCYKIGNQVISFKWSSESNILVGLHDSCYSIWYCPGDACSDPALLVLTTVLFDTAEFGKNVTLENFEGPNITFKGSGILYTIQVNIFCEVIHRFVESDMWTQALKICRHAQNLTLWATLAAMASRKNQLDITEEAYAATLQIDKVNYLQHIKNLPTSSPDQMAENSIMMGRIREAETISLNNKKISEAISLHLRLYNYEKALELAKIHNCDINIVLQERKNYLSALDKDEYSPEFLKFINKV